MNARAATCPSDEALRSFGLGKVDASTLETISAHLETCSDCRQIVAGVSGDSFVDRLREAGVPAGKARRNESIASSGGETFSGKSLAGRPVKPAKAADLAAPPELSRHPDYELLKELGRGGMGVVYLARNRMMDRLEVLKVVSKSLLDRPGALERFQQEIRSAAKLSHPNIVAAYSVLRPGSLLVFCMEYVEGHDLSQVVKQRGALPVTNAAFYAHQVALGLQHAHEKGMVHRDIKPNNLMLAVVNKKHVVKILDFGLAKATSEKNADHGLTKSGQMLGTPDYIAPEQTLDAQKADIRADIYSLGCTLYFMLAGHPPFTGESLYEILHAHHHTEAEPLNLSRPEVPIELAAIVSKMMAKDPAERYQAPTDVAMALNPFFKAGAQLPPAAILPSPLAGEGPGVRGPAAAVPIAVPSAVAQASAVPDSVSPLDSFIEIRSDPPRTKQSRRKPRHRFTVPAALGLLLLAAGIAAAVIFKVRTSEGVLAIEVSEPYPEVFVDGSKALVAWDTDDTAAEISLPPGSRKIELKKDGFEATGETVELERGGRRMLLAKLEPLSKPPGTPSAEPKADNPRAASILPPSTTASTTTSAPASSAKPGAVYHRPSGIPPPAIAPFDAKQARAHQEAWAKYLDVPVEQTNSIGMKLVLIPPGEFMMGSTESERRIRVQLERIAGFYSPEPRAHDENPQHSVSLTRACLLSSCETTYGQFKKFAVAIKYVPGTGAIEDRSLPTKMMSNADPASKPKSWREPGYPVMDSFPVEYVTWNEAVQFCNWLSDQEKLRPCYRHDTQQGWTPSTSGTGYRLPTEAEWEFACRGGTSTQFSFGKLPALLDRYSWIDANSGGHPRAVGSKAANTFGLFDMHGNVAEWCQDVYSADYYSKSPPADPPGPAFGHARVIRGGAWHAAPAKCRSAYRSFHGPERCHPGEGFRVVRVSLATVALSVAGGQRHND